MPYEKQPCKNKYVLENDYPDKNNSPYNKCSGKSNPDCKHRDDNAFNPTYSEPKNPYFDFCDLPFCTSGKCLNPNSNLAFVPYINDSKKATGAPYTQTFSSTSTTANYTTSIKLCSPCNCAGTTCTIDENSVFVVNNVKACVVYGDPATITTVTVNGIAATADEVLPTFWGVSLQDIVPSPWNSTCPTCTPASVLVTTGNIDTQIQFQTCGTVTTATGTCEFIATTTASAINTITGTSTLFTSDLCIPAPICGVIPSLAMTFNFCAELVNPTLSYTVANGLTLTGTLMLIPTACISSSIIRKALVKYKFIDHCPQIPSGNNSCCDCM